MRHDILGLAGDLALSLLVAALAVIVVGSILWGMYRGD